MDAQMGQQHGSPHGLGGWVDLVDCVLQQPDRRLDCAAECGRVGCPGEQVNAVKSGRPARIGHLLPELQGTLEVPVGLSEGASAVRS
jgi:hypothetical protein